MSTKRNYTHDELLKENNAMSPLRTTVMTTFFANYMEPVRKIADAYRYAADSGSAIILDDYVAHAKELGLPEDAKVIVENGGRVTGRTASARRIYGQDPEEDAKLLGIVRDVLHKNELEREYFKTSAYVGLDPEFMVKAHLAIPKEEACNLYSWLLNFQPTNRYYDEMYANSIPYEDGDIYIYSDPAWTHPDYPDGLAYFDPLHNVEVVLGMQYFGELKKGTLTLAWGTAHRNGFVACHGGQKEFKKDDKTYVASFYGLSGTGKSTLTHDKHDGKYDILVLHDDAFVVSIENGSSIALEPSYFDKTNDYPVGHPEQEYFVTIQNVGVCLDDNDRRVILAEDVRNGNGRTIKSRYSTPNRKDKFTSKLNAIFWLMKDDALPPILKINDPMLGMTFGATLATKRSTAENLKKGTNLDKLVIEPFANPFRVYPLSEDCIDFKDLIEEQDLDVYILNTGFFGRRKVSKEVTIDLIEQIVDGRAEFLPFGPCEGIEYVEVDGIDINFSNHYVKLLDDRIQLRVNYLEDYEYENRQDRLPAEMIPSLQRIQEQLREYSENKKKK